MPKIIENLESRLAEEARRQVREAGYSAMTIRSVAKACGVGVGTVYNYYPSKEDLTAAYMLRDWERCVDSIEAASRQSESPELVLLCIHQELRRYAGENGSLFQDKSAASSFAAVWGKYHALLRSQLAAPLARFCGSGFTAEFAAEAILTWTMAGKDFREIYGVLSKIL